ncbi:MAG: metallophosphoesterase [Candidatus Lokiarchaeota archaeon]
MKIAVISDTHDNLENISKAVSLMNKKNVDILIHCGDYVSPFTKRRFDGLNDNIKKNFYGVWGNNDGDKPFLQRNLGQICQFVGRELLTEFDGKKIYATHDIDERVIDAIAKSGEFNIVIYGHTHNSVNKKLDNGVLIVNPGEACGYLSGNASFAIIDTETMEANIIQI